MNIRQTASICGLLLVALASDARAWDINEEKDDFTEQKKISAVQLEGGFVFFFTCSTGEGSKPDLRVATTMEWTNDLKSELDVQFKGPSTPLISVSMELTSNQSNKVLMISRESDSDDVIGLMRAFAETKPMFHFAYPILQTL